MHRDEEQHSETDMVEEYGLFSIALVSLQTVLGLLYALVRLCQRIRAAHGRLAVNAEPVMLRGELPSPVMHTVPTPPTKRSSVYFGIV